MRALIGDCTYNPAMRRVFLLSPASCSGRRAGYLLREGAKFDLARRLRSEGVTLGEAFTFMSGLYFRGKLAARIGPRDQVVLLGSIASDKYVHLLCDVFGEQLLFPAEFIGRGDMSRRGLLLRSVLEERQLTYIPVVGAKRRGQRPPRLPRIRYPRDFPA